MKCCEDHDAWRRAVTQQRALPKPHPSRGESSCRHRNRNRDAAVVVGKRNGGALDRDGATSAWWVPPR